jgi:hypothetical protein
LKGLTDARGRHISPAPIKPGPCEEERGIDISHETVRFWWNRFGPMFAAEICKRRVAHMRGYPMSKIKEAVAHLLESGKIVIDVARTIVRVLSAARLLRPPKRFI